MNEKLVYRNSDGIRRTMHFDRADPDKFTVQTDVDVTSLIENNRLLEEAQNRPSVNKVLARVPMTIYEQSLHENWDEADWKKWLNDSDNAAFRVWRGRV